MIYVSSWDFFHSETMINKEDGLIYNLRFKRVLYQSNDRVNLPAYRFKTKVIVLNLRRS